MLKANFIKNAIANGFTGERCEGWDWIKNNLPELDYIFQTEEYKKCEGYKYKCMPLLYENDEANLTELEKDVLSTAWYLNNQREREKQAEIYHAKMLADGWIKLTADIVKLAKEQHKKLLVNARINLDFATVKIDKIYKPALFGDIAGLMDLKARTRGYYLTQFKNAYCKLI
jgi:hypothetical protein